MADLTIVSPTAISPAPPKQGTHQGHGSIPPLTKNDLAIVALDKMGIDEATISQRLHIKTITVQRSLLKWYRRQLAGSSEMVHLRVNEMGLEQIEEVNKLIADGLRATKPIFDENNVEIRREPDLAARRQFARDLREWLKDVQPKAPLIAANLTQNNQTNTFNNGSTRGLNMEGRLRAIREKHGLRNDDEDVVDAEFIDEEIEGDELDESTLLEEGDGDEDSSQG